MRQFFTRIGARCLIACALIGFSGIFMTHFVSTTPQVRAATAPVKIMPLGDSITGSPGCWRALLWNNLQNAGYTNIDFVGTQPPQGCGIPYDGDNEGHGGALATNIVSLNELPGWLSATNPDVVLMHLGTNDVWSSLSPTTILAAYTTLIGQMRANNPLMKILVAQIIPMNPSGCTTCAQGVVALNAAIPAWASSLSTAQSPIIVVDQWTGFDDSTDTVDGVHPNDSGNQKMASKWFPPLTAVLNTLLTPVPPTTPTAVPTTGTTPTATPTHGITPTPTAPGGITPTPTRGITPTPTAVTGSTCKIAYQVQNQWPGGFTTNVTITNTGSAAINGWTLHYTYTDPSQLVGQGWSATWSQTGEVVTATNLSWNSSIAPGASIPIGFNGTFGTANPSPTNFTLNTVACTSA